MVSAAIVSCIESGLFVTCEEAVRKLGALHELVFSPSLVDSSPSSSACWAGVVKLRPLRRLAGAAPEEDGGAPTQGADLLGAA